MIGNKTVVYTSGTFDMLHANHIKMIEYARSLGDILIIGVNTDELVATYKSEPIIPFDERIALVKALKYPDIVIPQNSLDHTEKVKELHFDIFVVGDAWVEQLNGYRSEMELKRKEHPGYVDPAAFIARLSEKMEDDAVYVADVGQNQIPESDDAPQRR